jgi:phenylacetate-CoA ligase
MEEAGLKPRDVRTTQDLGYFPMLSREQLQRAPSELLSDQLTKVKWRRTSGTSGVAVGFIRCPNSAMWSWAAIYRYFRWMDVRPGARRLDLWGARDFTPAGSLKDRVSGLLWRRRKLVAYQTADAEIDEHVRFAEHYRPSLIRGYASALYRFAHRAAVLGANLPSLKAISSTADCLTHSMRRSIEETLCAGV